jgi:hypothetical protein
MRNLIIVAIWLGVGFAITEFIASYLEASRNDEHQAIQKLSDPARDARDVQATGPATPTP